MALREKNRLKANNQIKLLESLYEVLKTASNYTGKLAILSAQTDIVNFLSSEPHLEKLVTQLDTIGQYVVKSLLAIGQGPIIFQEINSIKNPAESLKNLLEKLLEIEKFYDTHGGIIGYHLIVLKLLEDRNQCPLKENVNYEIPPGLDISKDGRELDEAIRWGLETMRLMGEMYPLGGAGDRLSLKDEKTGDLLPVAQLFFCGRTLLESLIRDLQGREFLYYKLFGKQIVIPLAIMTSHEKDNHNRIMEICKSLEWFGRPIDSFRFFIQPLVPMVTTDGEWIVSGPMQLTLKPGGHGVIWKTALDEGIFDWFDQQQKKKILIRQINNPMAGVDAGLLVLSGIGCQKNKDFGFASCQRMISASEGMDVLKEIRKSDGYEYCITNVEYTEFKQCGIHDGPEKEGSPYSCFPANTNILFADLAAVKNAVDICSIPGMLINLKSRVSCYSPEGVEEKLGGRLESTMQNIADCIVDFSPKKISERDDLSLRTFLTYNERRKTISVAKQSYTAGSGKSLIDTPEGCFLDLQNNYRDLLVNHCGISMPQEQGEEDYMENGPDCITLLHPALGMLYPVIGQKIKGGKIAKGSEFILEISEVDITDVDLEGSVIIEAKSVMGPQDAYGLMVFDTELCGKCTLTNVKVRNQGRVRAGGINSWKCQIERTESLNILLHGNAEFVAEDVELHGDVHFEVHEGHRLVVYQQGEEIAWHYEKIKQASWRWDYFFEEDDRIVLEKVKTHL